MSQLARIALVACCIGLAAAADAAENRFYDRSYAVVVGIDVYASSAWPGLDYAVKDAEGVARLLSERGFEVVALYNEQATRRAILTALQDQLAPRLRADDRVLVFFAGHGHTDRLGGKDRGYVIPHEAEVSADYIAMEELQRQSSLMDVAKHQLFVMDACYGGLLGLRGIRLIPPERQGYLEEITGRKARHVLTAGGADQQVADSGPGGHSVFTGYFLKAIQEEAADLDGDGWITFSEIQSYITPAATNEFQTPGSSYFPGHELGEIVFASPQRTRQPEISAPPPRARSLRDRGGVASFLSAGDARSSALTLSLSTLECEAANDPRNEDEIYIEVEGRLPSDEPYLRRFGTWEHVCKDPRAVPVPVDLWSGEIAARDRLVLNVWVREEDKRSGPEDVLAFQFDASADEQGDLHVQVVGLPVLEDTQRERAEMAITLVQEGSDSERSASLVADYVRDAIWWQKKRVAYRGTITW